MGLISDLKPINLEEEKHKFFLDFSYNPQFKYIRSFSKSELEKYGYPQKKFYNHAVKMLDKYGLFFKTDTKALEHEFIKTKITQLFQELKIKPIPVVFSEKMMGRVLIKDEGLFFNSKVHLNSDQLTSILNHEIQTHYLRKLNDRNHNLNSITENNPNFRLTEEGLANLHSFVERKDKIIKKTYLNYMATFLAQKKSFADVFALLKNMGQESNIAWNITLKQKRGLEDTSKPGGFTKDLVYFEGIVKVWDWMINHDNDPRDLYLGRISLEDIKKTKKKVSKNKTILPSFMHNLEEYRLLVSEIGRVNDFEKLI